MEIFSNITDFIWNYIVIVVMLLCALWFGFRTRFVQITMLKEMFRAVKRSGTTVGDRKRNISSFEAFMISLASRVGVGNLAGVALAITVGGPGAVFWMWVMAIINSVSAFMESTLAQLYKSRRKDSFIGGPAYYIQKGLHSRTLAVVAVVLNIFTFSFGTCSVQSNTMAISNFEAFGISPEITAVLIAVIMLFIVFGGIHRIAKFSSVIVPVMAAAYILVALFVVVVNIREVPTVLLEIVKNAFGIEQIAGGSVGAAFMLGTKRGLFSNEAGMGSAPNAAATADVPHPVNQGLIQTLGVFVDTLCICSCTAFIVMLSASDIPDGTTGIALTQYALSKEIGAWAYPFVALIIFIFGFSTCIGNAYYGEANMRFLTNNGNIIDLFRIVMVLVVVAGALVSLETVWVIMDFLMAFMVIVNLVAITAMGNKVYLLLKNYRMQRKQGIENPVFRKKEIPALDVRDVECW
ncbi:MAG: alanine:cation symporter family protein [Bacteroidetes bacterium]|uniref:Alanine:cation symporter family protein n=1 Tax=Candidatus Caccoplasma merdipullorum TaxID=2840718 RepID=A0A9D9E5H4_9BACT|nr:alanine:cation symporter family protein [Candidatus Caccoplasma merdipullorum]